MHIFLYGPPGTGKSTIGKLIARSLKLPFVDLDRVIEEDTDMPISEIMERRGESAFRDLEAAALSETMGHVLSVTWITGQSHRPWRRRAAQLRGVEIPEPLDPAGFDDRKSISAHWDTVEQNMRAYLAALRDDLLFEKPFADGEDKDFILWQVLLHVVNHGTDHRAQLLRLLYDL